MPLSELLAGWTGEVVRTGMSGASVERLTKPGELDRYRKSAPPTWDSGLDAEAARLRWLASTPLADRVARIIDHGLDETEGIEHLVTTAVPGVDGVALAEACGKDTSAARDLAQRYGAALRTLHDSLDPASCPFDGRLDIRLAAAERRAQEGRVDVDDFEAQYVGRTPRSLLDQLHETRPAAEDLVVCHGDWCYPNVLFVGDEWSGMVDLASLGVSCRWHDLGIGVRTTRGNLGDTTADAFLDGYGIDPDPARIDYYILLDELQ